MNPLDELRMLVNQLDEQITTLLDERMAIVKKIGDVKRSMNITIGDLNREAEVCHRVSSIARNPILKAGIETIFQSIMKESRIEQRFFRTLSIPFRSVGVIGLGFIGGSICKALRTKNANLIINGLFYPSDDQRKALDGNWIDRIYSAIPQFVEASDIVIMACPLKDLQEWVLQFAANKHLFTKKIVIMDVASVKNRLIQNLSHLSDDKIEFVTTNPVIQNTLYGFDESQVALFVNSPWVITPHEKNTSSTLESIHRFIQYLGADPIYLNAETHDQRIALISQIPSSIAKLYYDFVFKTDPTSFQISGDHFKSFAKLATDNVQLQEVQEYNTEKVLKFMKSFADYINEFLQKNRKKRKTQP